MGCIIPVGAPAGGVVVAGQVGERLQQLREHHVDHMPDERKIALVARCCGVKVERIANIRKRSTSAVYRDLGLAQAAILGPLGLDNDMCLAAQWVVEHRTCCLAAAVELVENTAEFAA